MREYLKIFSVKGTVSLQIFSLIARIQVSALPLALILFAVERFDSYAVAGMLGAAQALSTAVSAPYKGRVVDSKGISALVNTISLISLLAVLVLCLSESVVISVLAALMLGLGRSNATTYQRVLWRKLYADNIPLSHLAISFEAAITPLLFAAGPPLTVLLIAIFNAQLAFIIVTTLSVVATLLFSYHRLAQKYFIAHHSTTRSHAKVFRFYVLLISTCLLASVMLGMLEVFLPAKAEAMNWGVLGGASLGIYFLGGLFGGLIISRSDQGKKAETLLSKRITINALLLLLFIPAPGALFLLIPFFIGAVQTSIIALAQTVFMNHARKDMLTEVLSWWALTASMGVAVGNLLAGALSQSGHFNELIALVSSITLIAAGLAWLFSRKVSEESAED